MNGHPPLLDRILLPYDGSVLAEQAIPYVQSLAQTGTQVVVLIQVVPQSEPIRDPLGRVVVATDLIQRHYRELARQDLHHAAELLRRGMGGLRIQVVVEEGDPAERILHVARDLQVGMIVMASAGHGAMNRLAYGSVADRVVRAAEVPVMIVRARDALGGSGPALIKRIIIPLDGSDVAARALPTAEALAKRLQASIMLVTVVDVTRSSSPMLAYAAAFSQDLYDGLLAGIKAEAQAMLERVGSRLMMEGIPVTWEVLTGPTAGAIMDVACPGDVIVMTSHGRSGIRRWLIGSVAEKLVRAGPVPVIVVPAGTLVESAQPVIGNAAWQELMDES